MSAGAPVRFAAIDVGSNAIRLLAVEPDEADGFRSIAEHRVAVRLGSSAFTEGRIAAEDCERAVEALVGIAARMRELGVERYRAVATSAVRESANRRAFIRRASAASGLRLEVISGLEEIRLVHASVRRRIDLGRGAWALVELGGGSVEVAVVDAGGVKGSETHAMGAVRLMQMFCRKGVERPGYARLIREYAATLRLSERLMATPVEGFIATGGNIESLAKICRGGQREGTTRLRREELDVLCQNLARMNPRAREQAFELRPDRADVILPAAVVSIHLAELFGVQEIIVPGGGVREGIMLDLMERYIARPARSGEQEVSAAALALGRKYEIDVEHATQVERLAVALFDDLASVHELKERDRRLLSAAALLHDVGAFVGIKNHHKHSLYLISRSELPGFTARETAIVACVARYHRKVLPSLQHPEFARLSSAERLRVRKLAALLRVADALDKEHRQRIVRIAARERGAEVEIRVEAEGDLLLEQWALERKEDLFNDVYGRRILLAQEGTDE